MVAVYGTFFNSTTWIHIGVHVQLSGKAKSIIAASHHVDADADPPFPFNADPDPDSASN